MAVFAAFGVAVALGTQMSWPIAPAAVALFLLQDIKAIAGARRAVTRAASATVMNDSRLTGSGGGQVARVLRRTSAERLLGTIAGASVAASLVLR
jgi:hypothetical protein